MYRKGKIGSFIGILNFLQWIGKYKSQRVDASPLLLYGCGIPTVSLI